MNDRLPIAERIWLVGMRGSGKSTVGRLLAARLGWAFADADDEVETRAGCSIAKLFESVGVEGFRVRESEVLRELAILHDQVIASGGGIVVREENRELLRLTGLTIWLSATPGTLAARVARDSAQRPPLVLGGPHAEAERVLREREPWYREVADMTIRTDDLTPDEVAAAIVSAWASS